MSHYLKKLYREFIHTPEYDDTQHNCIVNSISRYPNMSFLVYLLVKNYFFPRRSETPLTIDTIYSLCTVSINVLFFQGVLHYVPTTIVSCTIRALVCSILYKSPHLLLYCFFTSLSRLRYSLYRVLSDKLLYISLVLFLHKLP